MPEGAIRGNLHLLWLYSNFGRERRYLKSRDLQAAPTGTTIAAQTAGVKVYRISPIGGLEPTPISYSRMYSVRH